MRRLFILLALLAGPALAQTNIEPYPVTKRNDKGAGCSEVPAPGDNSLTCTEFDDSLRAVENFFAQTEPDYHLFLPGGTSNPSTCDVHQVWLNDTNDQLNICWTTDTWTAVTGGSAAFSAITSGTNTAATMVVGAGASLRSTSGILGIPNGTTDPATCTEGDAFWDTDNDELNLCSATNTWTPITGGGGGNSFATWDVQDGTDPVADSASDTMTVLTDLSGVPRGITVQGDATADSLTFMLDYIGHQSSADPPLVSGQCLFTTGDSGIVCEGASANTAEGTLVFPNVTTDQFWTLPLTGGTISALGATIDDTEITAEDFGDWSCSGAEDGCTVDADSVALGTDTTGNYVSSATAGGGLALTGTEGASLGVRADCATGQIIEWDGDSWECGTDDGGTPGEDSIGTTQLDDDANTPVAGAFVVVETGAASFDYLNPNAGTDVTADLEEETHASEHAENAADELLAENLGSACTAGQTLEGDGTGGVVCGTDDGGSGSGDNVSVNTSAATDADFTDSTVIEWSLNTGPSPDQITATIVASSVTEAMLKAVDSAVDEECLTYETTTGDFEWQTCGGGGSGDIEAVGDVTSGAAFDGTAGNVLQFEGSTADVNETTLTAADPDVDRTITLPNASGTVTLGLHEYDPERKPQTGCTTCEEFTDGAESASWTWGNQGSAAQTLEKDGSRLSGANLGDGARCRWVDPPASGDFTAAMRASYHGAVDNGNSFGIAVLKTGTVASPTGIDFYWFSNATNTLNLSHQRASSGYTVDSTAEALNINWNEEVVVSGYFLVQFNDTANTLEFYNSQEGTFWGATNSTTGVTSQPVKVGYCLRNSGTGSAAGFTPWFRIFSSLTTTIGE